MRADLTLAREMLGYAPKVPLEEGMRLAYELDPRLRQAGRGLFL